MSEEGGHGVAADAAESAAQQSGIKLIPGPARYFLSPLQGGRFSALNITWVPNFFLHDGAYPATSKRPGPQICAGESV